MRTVTEQPQLSLDFAASEACPDGHVFRPPRAEPPGACLACGLELVDWDRLHRRDPLGCGSQPSAGYDSRSARSTAPAPTPGRTGTAIRRRRMATSFSMPSTLWPAAVDAASATGTAFRTAERSATMRSATSPI